MCVLVRTAVENILAVDNFFPNHPVLRAMFICVILLTDLIIGFLCVYDPIRIRDRYLQSFDLDSDFDPLNPRTYLRRPPPLKLVRAFGGIILLIGGLMALATAKDYF
jgi:hypothetical protein